MEILVINTDRKVKDNRGVMSTQREVRQALVDNKYEIVRVLLDVKSGLAYACVKN